MSKSITSRAGRQLLVAAGVIIAVGVAGCGSSAADHRASTSRTRSIVASLPPVPQLGSGDRQALTYIARAVATVIKEHGRVPSLTRFPPLSTARERQSAARGSPSAAILSSFAVLKLSAKTSVPYSALPSPERVFVNYVRVAQTRYGWPFKIVPVARVITASSQFLAREASAVRTSVAHASAKVRAKVLQIEHELQLDQQYDKRHPEGICVTGYHEASLCEPFLNAETRGGLSRSASSDTNSVSFYLVPNGVSHITARYPNQDGSPSRTITVPVINNLAVWKMTDEPGEIIPTIQWRAADGRIIRTIPSPI